MRRTLRQSVTDPLKYSHGVLLFFPMSYDWRRRGTMSLLALIEELGIAALPGLSFLLAGAVLI